MNTHKIILLLFIVFNVLGFSKASTSGDLVLKTKHAILNLDTAAVERLVDLIDVNQLLADNSSLLAWAVETQQADMVRLLISKGAKPHVANGNRFTPIIQACRYGNSEIINMLLDIGADPLSAIEDGTHAFHLCAASASLSELARMLDIGVSVVSENDYGQTALMWAANAGKPKNIDYLIQKGARVNHQTEQGYNPLFFAIKSQHLASVKTLVTQGADLSAQAKDGTHASQLAVYTQNYPFLLWFAKNMPSLMTHEQIKTEITRFDRDGYQLLHAATRDNQPELVSTLIQLGANPSTVSKPSQLTWRYEANFKVENYIPPQLSAIDIADQNKLASIRAIFEKHAVHHEK